MNLGSILGGALRFIQNMLPRVMDLGGLLGTIMSQLVIAVKDQDVPKIEKLCQTGFRLANAFVTLGEELRELFDQILRSIQPDSEGGSDLSGNELKAIADEGDDIPEAAKDLIVEIDAIQADARALL